MELLLLRHAIPVDPDRWGGDEPARPLTPQGEEQAASALQALADTGKIQVDAIWSSPYTRCQQTAQIAAEILGISVQLCSALASGANLLRSLPKVQGDPTHWPTKLLCVGHSPDLGNLISELTGDRSGHFSLGRCGSAHLTGEFASGRMKLLWLLTADQAKLSAPVKGAPQ